MKKSNNFVPALLAVSLIFVGICIPYKYSKRSALLEEDVTTQLIVHGGGGLAIVMNMSEFPVRILQIRHFYSTNAETVQDVILETKSTKRFAINREDKLVRRYIDKNKSDEIIYDPSPNRI